MSEQQASYGTCCPGAPQIPRKIKRLKPRKYPSNDYIDSMIRKIYIERQQKKSHALPAAKHFAQKIGWPKHAILRRAQELGLCRAKEKPWSEAELQILERYALYSDDNISERLRKAGFIRSRVAVHLKVKCMRFKKNVPFYSATALAEAFGTDTHTITRWIKQGLLKFRMKESDRTPQQGGDIYLVHEKDVRRFVVENPMEFDLRKVDQLWFLDIITKGRIAS